MSIKRTKGILGLIITICMLVSLVPTSVFAASYSDVYFDVGNFTYRLNSAGDGAILMSIKTGVNLTGEVVVPDYVDFNLSNYSEVHGSKKVYALQGAFTNKGAQTRGITRIVLPDHMTTFVGNGQFQKCENLTSIHLPAQLNDKLISAFSECYKINTLELPSAITTLGQNGSPAFAGSGIKSVIITGTTAVDLTYAWGTSTGMQVYYPTGGTAPKGSGFTATAYGAFTDGWVYSVSGTGEDAFVVLRDTVNTGVVTIPDTLGGVKVGYIKEMCFQGKTGITQIIMSNNVTRIEDRAFARCTNLTNIKLSENLVSGTTGGTNEGKLNGTFLGATSLKSVVIPKGINTFEKTFGNTKTAPDLASGVETVILTNSTSENGFNVDAADKSAFANGKTFAVYVPVGKTVSNYTSEVSNITGRIRYYDDKLAYAPGDGYYAVMGAAYTGNLDGSKVTLSGEVVIPEKVNDIDVTMIENQAFNGQSQITSLVLPNTVTSIGYQAFMEMDGLTRFDMPDSVETIGYGLFYGCNNLEEVKLSKNLKGTMQTTFAYCSKLKNCIIPDGVTTLNKTFMYCNIINLVVVPASVTTITGDSTTDIREALFSTFNTEGVVTGAPTEPGFVVMGTAGSAIDTYMSTKGWKFKAIDFDMPFAIQAPKPHSDKTVTVNVANIGKADKAANMTVYCAYYDKEDGRLIDVGLIPLSVVKALDVEEVTVTMNEGYDAMRVYAHAFVWEDGTLIPFAEMAELYETVGE